MVSTSALSTYSKLTKEFPLLSPCDTSLSAYAGFMNLCGIEYRIFLRSDCTSFKGDDSLSKVLRGHESTVLSRLKSSASAYDFLIDLRDFIERLQQQQQQQQPTSSTINNDNSLSLPHATYYNALLVHLSAVGWHHVCEMDTRLRWIVLQHKEQSTTANRLHKIRIDFSTNYPYSVPKIHVDLPLPFQLPHNDKSTINTTITIEEILSLFANTISKYSSLFDALDDFDSHTCVLEPEFPTRRDTFRRIALTTNASASIRIQLDAIEPLRAYPRCVFLGSDRTVAPLRAALNARMHLWDTSGSVMPRTNLERVLQIEFPKPREETETKEGQGEEEAMGECGICYSVRDDGKVSDVACERIECGKMYHRTCILDWLRALPDTRESFGTLIGKCVYCEESISVSTKDE